MQIYFQFLSVYSFLMIVQLRGDRPKDNYFTKFSFIHFWIYYTHPLRNQIAKKYKVIIIFFYRELLVWMKIKELVWLDRKTWAENSIIKYKHLKLHTSFLYLSVYCLCTNVRGDRSPFSIYFMHECEFF